jgi:hypothetical protein
MNEKNFLEKKKIDKETHRLIYNTVNNIFTTEHRDTRIKKKINEYKYIQNKKTIKKKKKHL